MDPESTGADPEVPGVRPPKQERSRRTLERIVAAAAGLLRESGVEGTTVSDIVERANTSVGSFYARFPGKDELVRYLRDRFRGEVLARWDERVENLDWAALPLGARVEEAVALLVRTHREDWGLSRVLDGVGPPGEESGWWARGFRRHAMATLTPALLAQAAHPRPEIAVEAGLRMVAGAIRDAVEVEDTGGAEEEPDALRTLAPELARAWTAYLEAWRPEEEGGGAAGSEPEATAAAGVRAEREAAAAATAGPDAKPEPASAALPEADFFDPWG